MRRELTEEVKRQIDSERIRLCGRGGYGRMEGSLPELCMKMQKYT